jgi:aromatic-L-amino-acid decarboxylase
MNKDKLELSPEEMRALGYRVVNLLTDHFANLSEKRVGTKGDPAVLRPQMQKPPPAESVAPDEIFEMLTHDIFSNMMNFVPVPSNFVSVMADTLASGFNVFSGSWLAGSGSVALELAVIDWLRQWCGLPDTAGGLFVSGGSMANLTAIVAARHAKLDDRIEGAVVYYSDQAHSSVDRAWRIAGLLPAQIRKIPCDANFRLPVDELARRIAEDRASGLRPFAIVANAGTTNTGAIDPLPEIAALAKANDLWLHVDGAYGAAAALCDRGRALLHGLELADSLSLDPHKWLFQSMECGCVLVRNAAILKATYRITPEYLAEVHRNISEVNPHDYGMQLTRSFRALKLWMSIQYFGLDAFRAAMERGFELAEFAESKLRATPGWEIVTPANMGIVTFHHPNADYDKIHNAMLKDGFALATSTVLKGRKVLRFCTINPRTTEDDITQTIDYLARLVSCI